MKTSVLIATLAIFLSCTNTPPSHPSLETVNYITVKNPELGYMLSIPDYYSTENEGPEMMCRYDDFPVLAINYVSMEEGDERGLWPDHKPDKSQSAPNGWILYSYTHYDGPFGMETRSYVKKIGDKFLSLDFRLREEDRPLEMKILRSFQES